MTTESSWPERFYTHFLARDICHLFSGGLLVCLVEYAMWGEIFLPKELSLELLGFLLISYFLGLTLHQIDSDTNLSGGITLPDGYTENLLVYQDLIKNYDENILNRIERIVFMWNSIRLIGLSSFIGAVCMISFAIIRMIFNAGIPTFEYLLLAISLLIYGIYMKKSAKKLANRIINIQINLTNKIASEQKKNTKLLNSKESKNLGHQS